VTWSPTAGDAGDAEQETESGGADVVVVVVGGADDLQVMPLMIAFQPQIDVL
jgi:hypothetical protein